VEVGRAGRGEAPRIVAPIGAVEVGRAGRGESPHAPSHGSAPWKLAALDSALAWWDRGEVPQSIAARPGGAEIRRTGRGEIPTQEAGEPDDEA
jgi:hypothetical protein